MLRIGYVRNTIDKPIERPTGYLFEDRNLRDLAGYHIAQQTQPIGAIPLYAPTSKWNIAYALTGQPLEGQVLGYLPYSKIYHTTKKRDASYYYSLPSLLGGIYDVLRTPDDQLEHLLVRWSQPKTYSVSYSPLEEAQGKEQELSRIPTDDPEITETSLNGIVRHIITWEKIWETASLTVNPLLLGRIMTRYTVATDSLRISSTKLGDIFSLHIVLFLNSVLVEEHLWGGLAKDTSIIDSQIDLNNPATEAKVFIDNLSKIEANDYPLFSFFASCPLLITYLDPAVVAVMPKVQANIETGMFTNLNLVEVVSKSRKTTPLLIFSVSKENLPSVIEVLKQANLKPIDFVNLNSKETRILLSKYFIGPINGNSLGAFMRKIREGLTW